MVMYVVEVADMNPIGYTTLFIVDCEQNDTNGEKFEEAKREFWEDEDIELTDDIDQREVDFLIKKMGCDVKRIEPYVIDSTY